MPLPVLLGICAVAPYISGGAKSMNARNNLKIAQKRDELAKEKIKLQTSATKKVLDQLSEHEHEIVKSFDEFVEYWEKVKNKPNIAEINLKDATLPEFNYEKFKTVLVLPDIAKNAVFSTLISQGATTVITIAVPGLKLLLGGLIFDKKSKQLSEKVDASFEQMKENEKLVDEACEFLKNLSIITKTYTDSIIAVKKVYYERLNDLKKLVDAGYVDWKTYSDKERKNLKNLVLLVKLLYEMCKVELITENEKEINSKSINENIKNASNLLNTFNDS